MSRDDSDRREDRRAQARVRVRFRSTEELVTAYTRDVSRGGLYVAAARQLPPGAIVELHLELPDGDAPAVVTGRVAYALDGPAAAREGREAGMGLSFSQPDTRGLADRIAAFLASGLAAPAPEPARASSPLDLVVAGASPSRRALANGLEQAGHRVRQARDGLEALGQVLDRRPDAVLCEIDMPVMDVWQLLSQLRFRVPTRRVPVALLAAPASEAERERGYERGVDDFIPADTAPVEVGARLGRMLERSGRQEISEDGVTGMLEEVSAISLLAFAEAERRSALLILTSDREQATATLSEGRVTSVTLPDADPPAALLDRLLRLLDWEEGRFVLRPAPPDPSAEAVSVQAALLEHARRHDERRR